MKKLFVLFLLPMLAFSVVEDWKTVQIDSRVSVDFPSEPVKSEVSGNSMWVAKVNDDSQCMLMIVDFEKLGLDSSQVAEEMGKEESFEDFRNSMLQQMKGASLISERKSTMLGYRTFDFLIQLGKETGTEFSKLYNRNVFIGSKMYSLSFYEKEGKPQEALRTKFEKSFKLN